MSLLLGTAKLDITPKQPIPLAGFALRKGKPFEAVSHPIYLRVLLFEQIRQAERIRALIVSADLLWWGSERMSNIRDRMQEKWGLKSDQIILNASHSHSGPQTSTAFPFIGPCDLDYVEFVEERLFEGVEMAYRNMEAVLLERGIGTCDMTTNRRKLVNNQMELAPNKDGQVDHEVNVIRFKNQTDETKALLVHFTGHPVTTTENKLSPEYSGMAMEYLEERLQGHPVSAFLQGCCGDINIQGATEHTFCDGTFSDICSYGRKLYDSVMSVLHQPMDLLSYGSLTSRKFQVDLPFERIPDFEELERLAMHSEDAVERRWAKLLIEEPERRIPHKTLEFIRLDLAEGLSFLTMNGEVVVDYGLFIKNESSGNVIPLGYSNGMTGYIPTEAQLHEGGYEAVGSVYPFSLPSAFHSGLEQKIKTSILQLL